MIGILRMFFAASPAENFKVLAAMAVVIAVVIVAVSFRPIPPKDMIACDGTVLICFGCLLVHVIVTFVVTSCPYVGICVGICVLRFVLWLPCSCFLWRSAGGTAVRQGVPLLVEVRHERPDAPRHRLPDVGDEPLLITTMFG